MSKNWFGIKQKVVIITGAAGLLGTQYAQALSEADAHVVVADINGDAAEEVVSNLQGDKAIAVKVDVTNPASVQDMVGQTLEAFGRIDGLVNNAALDPKFDPEHARNNTCAFETYPLDSWNQGIAVNLTGMFLCTQAVCPTMLKQNRGVIVNISSIYGIVGPDQRLYEQDEHTAPRAYKPVVYSVTKAAVSGLTRYLATYWAGKGIRVNALTLGGVFDDHDEGFVKRYSWRTPLGRMARKDEYCGALIFLLSDASSYMTGANLVIDGGWTVW